MDNQNTAKTPENATAVLVLNNGMVFFGYGLGAEDDVTGEICFNTSMTGYQEILTDPSYAGQIINFTFPHIGNVGTNDDDLETFRSAARGLIIRQPITNPSNFRSTAHFNDWLINKNLTGISGLDTRALTKFIRDEGAPNGIIAYNKNAEFDLDALKDRAKSWEGLEGTDLAKDVTCDSIYEWTEPCWNTTPSKNKDKPHVVAIDYGSKNNILRCLINAGFKVTVAPASTPANDILALNPDGIFLSNGPGDPFATGKYAIPIISDLIDSGKPLFGICLGHQLLALALGAKTQKMHLGHRGANHPVKDLHTDIVEITSQNHGFEVIRDSLPDTVEETHISLFDGSNEGIKLIDKPVFSVQYHPEASPGPQESYYLFEKFYQMVRDHG